MNAFELSTIKGYRKVFKRELRYRRHVRNIAEWPERAELGYECGRACVHEVPQSDGAERACVGTPVRTVHGKGSGRATTAGTVVRMQMRILSPPTVIDGGHGRTHERSAGPRRARRESRTRETRT